MIQICRKYEEKVCKAICTGKIDAAQMSFPDLVDDSILTLKAELPAELGWNIWDNERGVNERLFSVGYLYF